MTSAEKAITLVVEVGMNYAWQELAKVGEDSPAAQAAVSIARHAIEALGIGAMLRRGLILGLAKLDPSDLAAVTEAASTTWRVTDVPRPDGE